MRPLECNDRNDQCPCDRTCFLVESGSICGACICRSRSTRFLDVGVDKSRVRFHSTFDPVLVTESVLDCLRKKKCDELAISIDCDEDRVFGYST